MKNTRRQRYPAPFGHVEQIAGDQDIVVIDEQHRHVRDSSQEDQFAVGPAVGTVAITDCGFEDLVGLSHTGFCPLSQMHATGQSIVLRRQAVRPPWQTATRQDDPNCDPFAHP
jgi:hypothetical protein